MLANDIRLVLHRRLAGLRDTNGNVRVNWRCESYLAKRDLASGQAAHGIC